MSVVKAHYTNLGPRLEYLSDPVVLSQAWKKSHNYIRRHNWYADVLDLDCSAVDLEANVRRWAAQLKNAEYHPSEMRMVPAPKSLKWSFGSQNADGWGPDASELHVLRPLAHLGIREQTVATAIMLCLADCIETMQRQTASWDHFIGTARVHSFGNRLHCKWLGEGPTARARFSWGNSDTYSQYFRDYRWFLQRPAALAQSIAIKRKASQVYLLKLDLRAFYDNISVSALIERLRTQYESYRRRFDDAPAPDDDFWAVARQSLTFVWNPIDYEYANLLRDSQLPTGLPQGMVASGFFANGYLAPFDQAMSETIDTAAISRDGVTFQLRDYSRYVDDLRLVVEICDQSSDIDQLRIANAISEWVRQILRIGNGRSTISEPNLDINHEKTGIEVYAETGGQSGVGARMQVLQQDLSGPFDLATLEQTEAGLEGLLTMTSSELTQHSSKSAEHPTLSLSSIGRPFQDVTNDTLARFSASRLVRSVRERFLMLEPGENDDGAARRALIHHAEELARRLIGAWAKNPSLGTVLRYAFDLFPSPGLLQPVLEALITKANQTARLFERHVALYLLADIYKAAATETGLRSKSRLEGFGNLNEYRMFLLRTSEDLLARADLPWFVLQQIYLFIATRGGDVEVASSEEELRRHRTLLRYVTGSKMTRDLPVQEETAVACVGYQINRSLDTFNIWFNHLSRTRVSADSDRAVEIIGQFDSSLLRDLVVKREVPPQRLRANAKPFTQQFEIDESARLGSPPTKRWVPLGAAVRYLPNPFSQENALIKLAAALLVLIKNRAPDVRQMTPFSILVKSSDWSRINNPHVRSLEVTFRAYRTRPDPRCETPDWCQSGLEWMYAIGRLLRSAATGESDFTTRHWLAREEVGYYRGIKSSWHKRRLGMMHTGEALASSNVPITPWFTELLVRLLQWPGTHVEPYHFQQWDRIEDPAQLLDLVLQRQAYQEQLYGVSSRLPIYVFPIDFPKDPSGLLRVAIVQGRRPTMRDIAAWFGSPKPPSLSIVLRRHLADLLYLVNKSAMAHNSSEGRAKKPKIDLIIFPELSICEADQDRIRALSDSTGAMIFFGLIDAKDPDSQNPINAGRWLIPVRRNDRRSWITIDQGKLHLTEDEKKLGITPWRPYQVVIELKQFNEPGYRMTGSICYDATDLAILSDLRDVSDLFVVAAMNKDVRTFDNMIGALNYHMYQHVVIANSGEFGGSTAQAPYSEEHKRLIAHVHGNKQIAISIFDIDKGHFGPAMKSLKEIPTSDKPKKLGKTKPAGMQRNRNGQL